MSATTEAAIRDRIIELIRGLIPEVDSTTTFRLYEDQRGANFRRYARGAPQAAARMFQVRSVPTRQPSDASNTDVEARLVTFDVIVAYPQTHRWGSGGARDRDRARESDQKLIENAIGRNGYGNFTGSHPNASWMSEAASKSQTATTWELSDAEGDVDFLVVRQSMRYFRANTPTPTWTVDATSGKGMPAGATEWAAALGAAGISSGGPSLQWDCSVAAGNLPDLIGTFTGTATIGPGDYAQTVTGWSAKGFVALNNAIRNVSNADAGLPNIASASCMLIGYVAFPAVAPAADRSIFTLGPTFTAQVAMNLRTTPRVVGVADPNLAVGTVSPLSAVRPVVVQINRTAGTTFMCTDQEKLTPALTATPTGKKVWIGGDNVQTWLSGGTVHLSFVSFFNAAAEMSQAQIKALLQTLGWSIAWT